MEISLEIKLPKIPDIELVALEGLETMGRHCGIPEEKINEAKVAVTESIINSIEHTEDENPYIKVDFTITKEKLIILVMDYGKGFNPEEIPEPDVKQKLNDNYKRGWGLKLMKSMSDDLLIESGSGGTRITIIKNLI